MSVTSAFSNAKWQLWFQHLSRFRHVEQLSLAGGGRRAIERQVLSLGKLTVRHRINLLLDPNESFLEFSRCAGYDLPDVGTIPAGGVVTGIGRIASHDCLIVAQDSTVKAGATYPISLKKALRAANIAIANNLPILSLVDSAGAFLPLQSEIFPDENHGGRTFYNQARHCAPQISVVLGHCTAGGAYTPMMTDQAVIVERQGAVFLGGPPLVKAALGTVLTTEELGGAKLHTVDSGCTDYRTKNEIEAMALTRDIFLKALPRNKEVPHDNFDEPRSFLDDVESLVSDSYGLYNARKVVSGLYDGSSFHEFKPEFGLGIMACYGSVMSYPVGTIITTGTCSVVSDPDSLAKFAHFVQICSSRNIPLLFVLNSSPRNASGLTEETKSLALAACARLMSVIATSRVPRISLLIGDYRADDVFFSSGLQPDFILSWPTARYYTSFDNAVSNTEHITEADEQNPGGFRYDAIYGTARLWDDGIVLPSQTRSVISRLLRIALSRSDRASLFSQIFWPQAPMRHFANIATTPK